jgi:hypothetical protein
MTASRPSPITQSASNIAYSGVQIQRTAESELATMMKRFLIKRAQRRCEEKEFRAWLAITAKPLW